MDLALLNEPSFKDLCRQHSISLAVLFGSQATGQAVRGSDIDLAVWLEKPETDSPEVARSRKKLLRDLINYLETGNIDLVILNRASPLLKFQVARKGRPVYQKTPELFAGFCSRALREHNDAQPFYRATEEYLRRVNKGRDTGG